MYGKISVAPNGEYSEFAQRKFNMDLQIKRPGSTESNHSTFFTSMRPGPINIRNPRMAFENQTGNYFRRPIPAETGFRLGATDWSPATSLPTTGRRSSRSSPSIRSARSGTSSSSNRSGTTISAPDANRMPKHRRPGPDGIHYMAHNRFLSSVGPRLAYHLASDAVDGNTPRQVRRMVYGSDQRPSDEAKANEMLDTFRVSNLRTMPWAVAAAQKRGQGRGGAAAGVARSASDSSLPLRGHFGQLPGLRPCPIKSSSASVDPLHKSLESGGPWARTIRGR